MMEKVSDDQYRKQAIALLKGFVLIKTKERTVHHINITRSSHSRYLMFQIIIAFMLTLFRGENIHAQEKNQLVRLAKLEIDSAQLENYKAALKEEIETSLRVEPGVLTLYAVSEKNNPTHITILEIYADTDAYKAHLQTPHFMKYKNGTREMVKSLELAETIPIVPGMKLKQLNE